MKLAEALILRADLQKRISELKDRLLRSAKIQEGEEPYENPDILLKELDSLITNLTDIVQRVNKVNSSVLIDNDETISDYLAKRDALKLKRSMIAALIDGATTKFDRYSRSEVKIFSTVNISDLQKKADDLAAEYRRIDTIIQEYNWLTDFK